MEEILIPNESKHDVVTFQIVVEGDPIDASYQVLSIMISKEINRIPKARLIILDGESADRQFEISNRTDFIPGNKITISSGRDGDNTQVFDGVIVKQGVKVSENGNSQLCIECKDLAYMMTLTRRSQYHGEVKDEEVFDELIGRYEGLTSDPEQTTTVHSELVQHHLTDWDFMLLRAEAVGKLVQVDDGTIKIAKPDTSQASVLQLSYGSSLLEFEAELSMENQWQSVQARSWDYENQEVFDTETSSADFTESGNLSGAELADKNKVDSYQIHHSGHVKEDELQDWADGVLLRSRLSKIRGRARFTGFAQVKPGDMVELSGVGDRYNGNVYVTAIRHELGHGMWDTHIQFGLDPRRYSFLYKDLNDAQAAGLVGGIRGLQIGKVVGLEGDPNGQDRILVKIPMIDNNAQGIWTRVASLDAGNERGAFFMPEIGDEVIVGFINDDPRDAVMLGMVHSGILPAPITATDDNHEKGFTTRSKMHIHFNDDTKTMTFDTPENNLITLDEGNQKIEIRDQNDNYILMDPEGITVESPLRIAIVAGTNIEMEATAEFSVNAASVSINASGNLAVEGAISRFAASGANAISGNPVNIN